MHDMTTTDIVSYQGSALDDRMTYAKTLASAGDLIPRGLWAPVQKPDGSMAPPAPSPGKVLLVLETGAMLGLHPVAALSGINVIEGKPAASAALMSAVIRGAGHRLRVTETGTVEGGDYAATATLIRSDDTEAPFTSTWTPHRAARAGLCTYEQKDGVWRVTALSRQNSPLPWQAYTESLCKARAISEVARDGAQDALSGVRYTPEELGATVDLHGEVVEGEVVDDDPAPSALPRDSKRPASGRQGTRRAPKKADPDPTPTDDAPTPQTAVQDDGRAEAEAAAAATGDPVESDEARKQRLAERRAQRLADEAQEAADAQAAADAAQQEAAARREDIVDADVVDDDTPAVLADDPAGPVSDTDWLGRLRVARIVPDTRAVWDDANAAGALTTDLRNAILARKAEIEQA